MRVLCFLYLPYTAFSLLRFIIWLIFYRVLFLSKRTILSAFVFTSLIGRKLLLLYFNL